MNIDRIILLSVWILTIGLMFLIPRVKRRLAVVAFLIKQLITLILGLTVVEFGLIIYPVRLFSKVNRASFTFEYFVYPAVCSLFNVFFPNKRSKLFKLGYYAVFCTTLTIVELIIEKKTDLIIYIHWSWYWTWLSLFATFFMSRTFCVWFFKGEFKDTNTKKTCNDD
ncbi:MAG: hypothetical protein K6T88_05000 [Bacillus sp. (in: Bacteria)]|nr:hypothetical protein [Bacillus sp. (in: firmicutes)]